VLPPGPSGHQADGLSWLFRPYEFLENCRAAYGDAFTVDLGSYGRFVLFSQPEAIRQIFTGDAAVFHAGAGNAVLRPFLGDGSLLLLEEEKHLDERRLLMAAFRGPAISRHEGAVREIARSACGRWQRGDLLDLQQEMQAISLEVILHIAFGVTAHTASELRDALQAFLNDSKFNLALIGRLGDELEADAWRDFRTRLTGIHSLIDRLVLERRAAGGDGEGDILGLLLGARRDNGSLLEDRELREELLTLLVTGYETTATALAWSFYHLLRDGSVEARLLRELSGANALDSAYVDAFLSEVLRIHPVIPLVARELRAKTNISGLEIDAGVTVAPCIFLTHHRPELYTEPESFRPERFLERSYGPYEYLPFGGGARRCIGRSLALWEMKVVLSTVLPRVALELMDPEGVRPRRRSVTVGPSGGPGVRVLEFRE
jgi:cytochrome P450 family 110